MRDSRDRPREPIADIPIKSIRGSRVARRPGRLATSSVTRRQHRVTRTPSGAGGQIQASGLAARVRTRCGSRPRATSATLTRSRISRSLARSAIQTSCSDYGRAVVAEVLRTLAAHVGQRPVDDPDDVGQRDLLGRAGPASSRPRARAGSARCRPGAAAAGCSRGTSAGCPARWPAARRSPACSARSAGGDGRLATARRARRHRTLARGELDHRPQGVVDSGVEAHRRLWSPPVRTAAPAVRTRVDGQPPTRRSRPSWTAVAMWRPSSVNICPVARPRAPEADGLRAVVEEPLVGPERPVEPQRVVEAGADHPARAPHLAVHRQDRVEQGHVGGEGQRAGVQQRVVGQLAVDAHPDPLVVAGRPLARAAPSPARST